MQISDIIKGLRRFVENNKFLLIILGFLVFSAYRIMKRLGVIKIPSIDAPNIFVPDVFWVVIFLLATAFLIIAYKLSLKLDEKKTVVLIFLSVFFLLIAFTYLSKPEWIDAKSYYNIAALGAERGPIYIINNYHTLNTKWPHEFKESVEIELKNFGIYEFGTQKLKMEIGEPNDYSSRIIRQPPIWPFILSSFMFVFGINELHAMLTEWIVAALIPVILYFLIKRKVDKNTAIKIAFLFISIPAFLLTSNAPLLDITVVLFVLISFYFLILAIDKKNGINFMFSGFFLSLAFFTKFFAIFAFIIFFIIIIVNFGIKGGLKKYFVFLIPFIFVASVFMLLNYYFFLTLITAKVTETQLALTTAKGLLLNGVIRIYYINYIGVSISLFGILYLLKNAYMNTKVKITNIILILSFFAILFLFPYSSGMDRHLLPFILLWSLPVAIELKKTNINDNFIIFMILINFAQSVLFLL